MPLTVRKHDLPENALLRVYRDSGAFTDCYATEIDGRITQAAFIEAFYTTFVFKVERAILKWLVSKPSTDAQAALLASDEMDTFAAWRVEARKDDQILLTDFRGQTRSWLMSEQLGGGDSTRLYFGSAVIPAKAKKTGERRMGKSFSALLFFHKLYSKVLLSSARRRLSS